MIHVRRVSLFGVVVLMGVAVLFAMLTVLTVRAGIQLRRISRPWAELLSTPFLPRGYSVVASSSWIIGSPVVGLFQYVAPRFAGVPRVA